MYAQAARDHRHQQRKKEKQQPNQFVEKQRQRQDSAHPACPALSPHTATEWRRPFGFEIGVESRRSKTLIGQAGRFY